MFKPTMLPRQLETYPVDTPPSLPFALAALPPADEVRTHPLRYRTDQAIPETELWTSVAAQYWPFFVGATLATLGVHGLALLPSTALLISAVLLGGGAAAAHVAWAPRRSLGAFLQRLLLWPLGWSGAYWLTTTLLVHRRAAGTMLLLLALLLLYGLWLPAHPLRFWWDYLFCAPWLTRQTQRAQPDLIMGQGQGRWQWAVRMTVRNLALSGSVLFFVHVTAEHSTRRAILLLLLVGLFFTDGCRPKVWRSLQRVLAHALTYPDLPIPGNFIPQASLRARQWHLALTLLTLQLALSTGLTLYFPSELLTAPAPPQVQSAPLPTATPPVAARRPRVRKPKATPSPLPAPTPGPTPAPPRPNANTYAGLQKFVTATWEAKSISAQGLLDFIVLPLLFATLLPPLLLLAAWRGFLLEATRLEARLATLDAPQARTEWQWYVDRLQSDPLTEEVTNGDEFT